MYDHHHHKPFFALEVDFIIQRWVWGDGEALGVEEGVREELLLLLFRAFWGLRICEII